MALRFTVGGGRALEGRLEHDCGRVAQDWVRMLLGDRLSGIVLGVPFKIFPSATPVGEHERESERLRLSELIHEVGMWLGRERVADANAGRNLPEAEEAGAPPGAPSRGQPWSEGATGGIRSSKEREAAGGQREPRAPLTFAIGEGISTNVSH